MVFRKYRPSKQWGNADTRIFKAMLKARNARRMPIFHVPDAVKASGITVHNPNDPSFFSSFMGNREALPDLRANHPAFRVPSIEEHPLYKETSSLIFDGSTALSDGIDQAALLSKAIVREGFPENVLQKVGQTDISEEMIRDAILHGEKYDPTLEKLPRRFDPVLFWVNHYIVHGTPVTKRLNIILDNLSRIALLTGLSSGKLTDHTWVDRDEPLSAMLPSLGSFSSKPFVVRFLPHVTLQTSKPIPAWAAVDEIEELSKQQLPDIRPLSPVIDLGKDHIYNDTAVVPRAETSQSSLHTLLWCREQDQKYPWTKEQNIANAILLTFGAAVAEATKKRGDRDLKANPVVVKGVQLVNGKLDMVTFQLNTLDLNAENHTKNVVWIEKSCPLYEPKPFYEQLTEIPHVNMETVRKFVALLWNR